MLAVQSLTVTTILNYLRIFKDKYYITSFPMGAVIKTLKSFIKVIVFACFQEIARRFAKLGPTQCWMDGIIFHIPQFRLSRS